MNPRKKYFLGELILENQKKGLFPDDLISRVRRRFAKFAKTSSLENFPYVIEESNLVHQYYVMVIGC